MQRQGAESGCRVRVLSQCSVRVQSQSAASGCRVRVQRQSAALECSFRMQRHSAGAECSVGVLEVFSECRFEGHHLARATIGVPPNVSEVMILEVKG